MSREERRRARAGWEVRKYRLGEEPAVDLRALDVPEAERAEGLAQISLLAWRLSGRPLPDYDRASMPGRILRGVEPRAD
jgi:hypothetical protein